MSMFGRALGGLGRGASEVANKYIDANIQMAKAEALAEMQNRYQLAGAKALDEYNMGEERQGRITKIEADRARALGTAKTDVERAGRLALAGDTALTEAEIGAENRRVLGTVGAKIQAETQVVEGVGKAKTLQEIAKAQALLPLEVKLAYAKADAAGRASAAHREAPGADLAAKLAIVEKSMGRPLTEAEKTGLFGIAKATARDPELDTQTVVEERVDPTTGNVTKTTRKEVRKAGGLPGQPDGPKYRDGEVLIGPGDKKYVVENGVPVLESELKKRPAATATPKPPGSVTRAPEAPPYVPPAGSVAAETLAKRASAMQQTRIDPQEAQAAFAAATDRASAVALQRSPLFSALTPAQQAQVYRRANAP